MGFTVTRIDSKTAGAGTSIAASSWTPKAGAVYLIAVASADTDGTADAATVTGNNMTWTKFADNNVFIPGFNTEWRLEVYRAVNTGGATTGATTASFGPFTQSVMALSLIEVLGADTQTPVVQSNTAANANVTSSSVSLAAFAHPSNGTFAWFFHSVNEGTTPGTGFTELSDDFGAGAPEVDLQAEWKAVNDTLADASWGSTAGAAIGAAAELKIGGDPSVGMIQAG